MPDPETQGPRSTGFYRCAAISLGLVAVLRVGSFMVNEGLSFSSLLTLVAVIVGVIVVAVWWISRRTV